VHLGTGVPLNYQSLYRVYNGNWFVVGEFSGTLVDKETRNRLYSVVVCLYPTGSADAGFAGAPALTFDASKTT
jgi:hypothetical protein